MAETGQIGYGAVLSYTTSGTVYTTIANVAEDSVGEMVIDDIDVSSHSSSTAFKDFIPGLADGGEWEATLIYGETNADLLFGLLAGRAILLFKLLYTDGSHWTMTGYFKSFSNPNPRGDKIEIGVKMKVSGKPVFTKV